MVPSVLLAVHFSSSHSVCPGLLPFQLVGFKCSNPDPSYLSCVWLFSVCAGNWFSSALLTMDMLYFSKGCNLKHALQLVDCFLFLFGLDLLFR